jgi:alkylation response protein AidB-like acyl-CoA dehydrogenase
MDFTLNSEQELIRESAREFVAREIEPYARDWDRSEAMDRGIVAKLASAGFLGSALPEEHGGMAHRERGGCRCTAATDTWTSIRSGSISATRALRRCMKGRHKCRS